ncbi:BgtAc-30796 [Blumeria graminis f. sp. tritici]|uniref:BgtAc-30796 n=3 Tax=Blumeria graminis TaxID=34373 RepID=A0A9X9MGR6_BLUGR|nr:hypothetical protein BGT96224_Ac30796 [Blumeria graminis f. sp. tritici 96224]VDB85972.1 BgtAc-30796 [Blumeria graminis f. sp. tritici]
MVVTGTGPQSSYYGVYSAPHDNEFPVPSPHLGIHMSPSKIYKPGLHAVVYCSIINDYMDVIQVITRNLVEINHDPEILDNEHSEHEKNCLDFIRRNYNLNPGANYISKLSEDVCNHQYLANLAFRKEINVIGEFACFVPPSNKQTLYITADVPIKLEQFLAGNSLFMEPMGKLTNLALGWFQGHLHLFLRASSITTHNNWYPRTKIGLEKRSGSLISDYIRYSVPEIEKFVDTMEEFQSIREDFDISTEGSSRTEAKYKYRFPFEAIPKLKYYEPSMNLHGVPGYLLCRDAHQKGKFRIDFRFKQYDSTGKIQCLNEGLYKFDEVQSSEIKNQWERLRRFKIPLQSDTKSPAQTFSKVSGFGFLCVRDTTETRKKRKRE